MAKEKQQPHEYESRIGKKEGLVIVLATATITNPHCHVECEESQAEHSFPQRQLPAVRELSVDAPLVYTRDVEDRLVEGITKLRIAHYQLGTVGD